MFAVIVTPLMVEPSGMSEVVKSAKPKSLDQVVPLAPAYEARVPSSAYAFVGFVQPVETTALELAALLITATG